MYSDIAKISPIIEPIVLGSEINNPSYNPVYPNNKSIGCILQYWIQLCENKVLDYNPFHIGKDHK